MESFRRSSALSFPVLHIHNTRLLVSFIAQFTILFSRFHDHEVRYLTTEVDVAFVNTY
jgi:hypothetical protein